MKVVLIRCCIEKWNGSIF